MLSFDKIRRGSPHVQNIGFQEHADKIIAQHDIIHLHIIPRSMFTHRIRLLAGNADSLIPNGTNVHDYDHCATTTLTLTRDTQDTACISGKSTLHVKRQTQSKDPRDGDAHIVPEPTVRRRKPFECKSYHRKRAVERQQKPPTGTLKSPALQKH